MDKKTIQEALKKARESSKPRKFVQSLDLIVVLKELDLKKPENQVESYAQLHYSKGKNIKICGLVGPELLEQSRKSFETTILVDEFDKYQKDKKLTKKLAREHDFFVAQATIMPKVAQAFGRVLGPRGKMPNPKAGCVVPPNANLQVLGQRLHHLVKLSVKTTPMIQIIVGKEDSKEEEVVDNILTIYNHLVHVLPKEESNIKKVYLKTSMGKPVIIA